MVTERSKAIAAIITVSGVYVILSVVSRVLSEGFADFTQVYIRILIGTLVAAVLFNKHISWKKFALISKKDWLGIFLMGVVGYGVVVAAITIGAINTSLVNVSVIYSTLPFFTYLYSLLVFRKKPQLLPLLLLLLGFWGVTIMIGSSLVPTLTNVGKGDFFVLLSAAAGAWYVIGRKMTSDFLSNRELSVLVMLIAGVSVLAFAIIAQEPLNWSAFGMTSILIGLLIGALLNIVATFLENFGFKILDEVFGSQLLLMETIFAAIVGYLVYREGISWIQALGAILVIASVFLATRRQALTA